MNKVYRLKNGYSISKRQYYNGFEMQWLWSIYEPSGKLYRSCGTYAKAYEIASHL